MLHELRRGDLLAQGYAELLGRLRWQMFATLTWRVHKAGRTGGVHPEAASKAFRFFVSSINRSLYGRSWGERPHRGIQWATGQEFHRDGRLHLHAVLAAPTGDLYQLVRFDEWHRFWRKEFGNNRLERPRSQRDVSGYISKYVAKDGEVDFSANFGAWQPPPISYIAATRQPVLLGDYQQHTEHLRQVASPARVGNGEGPRDAVPILTLPERQQSAAGKQTRVYHQHLTDTERTVDEWLE